MNIVDVRGGTKEQKELTEKVVHFCIKELMPKVRTLDIEVSLKNKLDLAYFSNHTNFIMSRHVASCFYFSFVTKFPY